MSEKVMVDTQDYVNTCKRSEGLLILTKSCEKCEHYRGVMEVWPGKDGEVVMTKVSEMQQTTFIDSNNNDTGKHKQYDIICSFPRHSRAVMFAKLPDETEG